MSPHLARCLLPSFLLAATALGADAEAPMKKEAEAPATATAAPEEIGRASCRERVCLYV